MNERIRLLAEQCEIKEIGYYFFDREKFARLIVRECAEVASDPLSFTEAAYCHARVLKHFGI